MATMIPDDIQIFTEDGEGVFYRFIKAFAKPDQKYLCWYLPNVHGAEPDFVLYSDEFGLIIFEVKDWVLDQISHVDPEYFTLWFGNRKEKRRNPAYQVRKYFKSLMAKLSKDGYLVSEDHGNVKIPINTGIVFPNISKDKYIDKKYHTVIETERIFFHDDLRQQSPICSDISGDCFLQTVKQKFPSLFRFNLSNDEKNHLRQIMFPIVSIELPARENKIKREEEKRRLKLLDHHQESIARHYDGGHRIITGPSGSGKTLILVHRAALLKNYNDKIKNILFVCYNITLVNYIRRLLMDKHVSLGSDGVDVCHFFELCSRIIGDKVEYEKEEGDYYELVIEEALNKVKDYTLKYDAVLIDEGQDFSDDMLKIVTALLNPQTNHLAIALDDDQNIYRRTQSWKDVGIQARGRVHRLSWVYRNTREIADFARRIMDTGNTADSEQSRQMELFPETFEMTHGPKPEIKKFVDYATIAGYVAEKIRTLMDEEGYPLSDIAILYTMKSPGNDHSVHLPELLGKALDAKGILHNWISEDYRAKRDYDVTTERVTISTVHSLKGFDYACVFVMGLDWLEAGERWAEEQIRRIAYVAFTRARERLFVPWCSENDLIKKLFD